MLFVLWQGFFQDTFFVRLPLCLMFLVFFLSRKGSFNALMMRLVALGSTSTLARAYENHWFPVIRPAIKPLGFWGEYVRVGKVDQSWMMMFDLAQTHHKLINQAQSTYLAPFFKIKVLWGCESLCKQWAKNGKHNTMGRPWLSVKPRKVTSQQFV